MSAYETLTLYAERCGGEPATRIYGAGPSELVKLPLADVVAVFEGGGWTVDPGAEPVQGSVTLRLAPPASGVSSEESVGAYTRHDAIAGDSAAAS
jgi:hypothetical protein